MNTKFYCPTDDFDCPYYNDGICFLSEDAISQCDDAYIFYGDEDEEDD